MKIIIAYYSSYLLSLSFILFINCASAQKGLFDTDEVLQITLKGSLQNLINNRVTAPQYFPFLICLQGKDSNINEIPVQIKTRGHFRKLESNCVYPPLLINFFKNKQPQSSIFSSQNKLKLVLPCSENEYVIREWLVYKLYNILTPKSFKARLVKVILNEEKTNKSLSGLYGIFIESVKHMAKRNKMHEVEKKLKPQQLQSDEFLLMTIFQYLIANTDWSVQYLQNIKLLAEDSLPTPIAVPYDFDQAGIVNAPYAIPAEELKMNSIRERRYRGYCLHDYKSFLPIIEKFKKYKTNIYELYTNCNLISVRYKKSTIQFLDKFYSILNDEKLWQKAFSYPCDKNSTGNVVIKGLKTD